MEIRTYPYRAWVLNQNNIPKRVEFVERTDSISHIDHGDTTRKGRRYAKEDIFYTKEAAEAKAIAKR